MVSTVIDLFSIVYFHFRKYQNSDTILNIVSFRSYFRQKKYETETGETFYRSFPTFSSPLPLDDLVDVQYALPLVHVRGFAAPDGAGELVNPVLVDADAADYVGLKAEDADSGRGGELHLVAVAQFQEQLTALAL